MEQIVHYLASKYLVYYDETFWNFGHHNLSKKERTGPIQVLWEAAGGARLPPPRGRTT